MKFYGIDLHHDSFIAAIIDENNQITPRKVSLHLKKFTEFYKSKKGGKGAGKARVAIARKTFTYIYQMLKKDEYYRWMDIKNHARKMSEYRSFLKRKESEADMKKIA